MKKVIKLTENDLHRIVKRVILEQEKTFEEKLIQNDFQNAKNTKGKKVLAKEIPGYGDLFVEFLNGKIKIFLKTTNKNKGLELGLNKLGSSSKGTVYGSQFWFGSDEITEQDAENMISDFISSSSEMKEDRFDFENMSDEELHDLHPHVKRHPRHFKDFSPTSEYLGWRGEVDKRNIYKRYGKFHDAFDKKKED